MLKLARVVVGLSGGVDSAAAAILLMQMGHEVHALWMSAGTDTPERARGVAAQLGIPFVVADMEEAFRREVTQPFVREYLAGRTPNPCVICNPRVKFRALFDYAERNDCDFAATGHYARTSDASLYRGAGINDQSYMLYRLPDEWLRRIIFPLGGFLSKDETRRVAASFLPGQYSAAAPSMDICFIPEGTHADYIESLGVTPPPGDFVGADGRFLGRHRGIHRYTVGMRRHLGTQTGERMYVREIRPETNEIVLAPAGTAAPEIIRLTDTVWHGAAAEGARFGARVRHSRVIGHAYLIEASDGTARALVYPDCGTPAPGQSAVFYDGDRVAGGGIIAP